MAECDRCVERLFGLVFYQMMHESNSRPGCNRMRDLVVCSRGGVLVVGLVKAAYASILHPVRHRSQVPEIPGTLKQARPCSTGGRWHLQITSRTADHLMLSLVFRVLQQWKVEQLQQIKHVAHGKKNLCIRMGV